MPTGVRARLGEILLKAGVITEEQLQEAVQARREAQGKKPRLEVVLVERGFATEENIASTLSQELNLPLIDLGTIDIDPKVTRMVPQWLAERHLLVPLRRTGDGVMVAMSDPTNLVAIDDIKVSARVGKVSVGVATHSGVREATERMYSIDLAATEILNRLGTAADVEVLSEEEEDWDYGTEFEDEEEMAPIVALTNALLADAVRGRATDVHIEPQPTDVEVRYRIDGLLREVMSLPKHVQGLVVSRLKIMAGMDIAEKRRPQDGRTRVLVDGKEVDTRVSTIPTLSGEKVVMRLLYKSAERASLELLGLEDDQLEAVRQHLMLSQGLVIFTGPTGSGKTSTMYAGLSQMPVTQKNVVTLEDPIEYEISGVNQVQVDEKVGVTFARGLRSFLRQDPDVIMVGEIRDLETAQIVLQSALTGHLVLSSLHTNDAASAITRLVDIGVEPFLIASALSVVVAQRLVRVICPHCKKDAEISARTLKMLGLTESDIADIRLQKGTGCEQCGYTGYLGRSGIFEILPITTQIREQIAAQASEAVLTDTVRAAGVMSLREAGIKKVRAGITTLEEVLRVTYIEQDEVRRCPGCRHEVEASFVVCPFCQTDLSVGSCPSCGKDTDPEWQVCPYCRADLPHREEGLSVDRRRVLVVDDDEGFREMAVAMFGEEYDVLVAATGEEALRRANLERPDIILLDLRLPDIPGTEVTRRLRESALTSLIPVIMITAQEGSELESLRSGVDDHITKPFEEESLRARIEIALTRAARSARSPFMEGDRKSALRQHVLRPRVEEIIREVQRSVRKSEEQKVTESDVPEPVPAAGRGARKRKSKSKKPAPAAPENGRGSLIDFEIPEESLVSIALYNEKGILVRRLISSELMPPGTHSVRWDGTNNARRPAAEGTYEYQIKAESLTGAEPEILKGTTRLSD